MATYKRQEYPRSLLDPTVLGKYVVKSKLPERPQVIGSLVTDVQSLVLNQDLDNKFWRICVLDTYIRYICEMMYLYIRNFANGEWELKMKEVQESPAYKNKKTQQELESAVFNYISEVFKNRNNISRFSDGYKADLSHIFMTFKLLNGTQKGTKDEYETFLSELDLIYKSRANAEGRLITQFHEHIVGLGDAAFNDHDTFKADSSEQQTRAARQSSAAPLGYIPSNFRREPIVDHLVRQMYNIIHFTCKQVELLRTSYEICCYINFDKEIREIHMTTNGRKGLYSNTFSHINPNGFYDTFDFYDPEKKFLNLRYYISKEFPYDLDLDEYFLTEDVINIFEFDKAASSENLKGNDDRQRSKNPEYLKLQSNYNSKYLDNKSPLFGNKVDILEYYDLRTGEKADKFNSALMRLNRDNYNIYMKYHTHKEDLTQNYQLILDYWDYRLHVPGLLKKSPTDEIYSTPQKETRIDQTLIIVLYILILYFLLNFIYRKETLNFIYRKGGKVSNA
tara:strand:- start:2632 stop:4152 length:1521 start_codon:yes stop_codon:yes gene_type:complete